ncbi:MAG: T9SS type A sorting domain-containing protein [Bacteroidetes bacterium]|nr:T9SS type A sorting domain-containing protein [Bacteroidota bacterium]
MKRSLLVLASVILSISVAFAQNLQIYYNGALQTNYGTLTVNGYSNQINVLRLDVKNISSGTLVVKSKKIENSLISNTVNYFCFAGQCYSPTLYTSGYSATILPTKMDTSFSADYDPSGNIGTSTITYVFFNTANTADSVCLKVNFVTTLGVNEISKSDVSLSEAYPNPASNLVSFAYVLPVQARNAKIKISNILGATITELPINDYNGKKVFNTNDLQDGIYFYSLIINDKMYYAKKLIIKH